MKITKPAAILFSSLGLLAGAVGTIAMQTHAQSTTTDATATAPQGQRPQGHAPLGGDGKVTAISGTTITMQEEADEGGASYTVDASKATVTKNGTAGSLTDITVGEKIFVQGTPNGTSVSATSISVGHPGGRGMHGPDNRDAMQTQ